MATGLHADPTRCRVFHKCSSGGEKKTFVCRIGNIFDSHRRRCMPSQQGRRFTSDENQASLKSGRDSNLEAAAVRTNEGRRNGGGRRGDKQYTDTVKTDTFSLREKDAEKRDNSGVRLRQGRGESINSPMNIRQNTQTDTVSKIPAQDFFKKISIKSREQYTRRAKQSLRSVNSFSPIVHVAREPSLLSAFKSSVKIIEESDLESRNRQSPMRRFVIDGILPQYQNQLNDGVSRAADDRGGEQRGIKLASEPDGILEDRNQHNINGEDIKESGIFESGREKNNGDINQAGIFESGRENNNGGSIQPGLFESGQLNNKGDINQAGIFESGRENNNGDINQVGIFESGRENNNRGSIQPGLFESGQINNNGDINQAGIFESGSEHNNGDINKAGIFESGRENNKGGSIQPGLFESGQQNNNGDMNQAGMVESGLENNNGGSIRPVAFGTNQKNDNEGSNQFGTLEYGNNRQIDNVVSNLTLFQNEDKEVIYENLNTNLESIIGESIGGNTGIDVESLFNSLQENMGNQGDGSSATQDPGTDELLLSRIASSGGGGVDIGDSANQFIGLNNNLNLSDSGSNNQTKMNDTNENNLLVSVTGGYHYGPVIKEYKEQVRVTTSYLLGDLTSENPGGIKFINQFVVNQNEIPSGLPISSDPNNGFPQTFNQSFPNNTDGNRAIDDGSFAIPDSYLKIGSGEGGTENARPAGNLPNYNSFQGYQRNVANGFNNQFTNTQGQQEPHFGYTNVPNNGSLFQNTGPHDFSKVRGHFITETPPAGTFGTTQFVHHTGTGMTPAHGPPLLDSYPHHLPFNLFYLPQKPMFENSHMPVPEFPPPYTFYTIDPRIGPPNTRNSAASGEKTKEEQTDILAPGPADNETDVQHLPGSVGADRKESNGYDELNMNLPNIPLIQSTYQSKGNGGVNLLTTNSANPTSVKQSNVPASTLSFGNENLNTNPLQYLPPPTFGADAYENVQSTEMHHPGASGNDQKDYVTTTSAFGYMPMPAVTPPTAYVSTPLPFFGNPFLGPQLYTTVTPYISQTTLTPLDVYNINHLQSSTPKGLTRVVNQFEIVRSISFSLDSDEGRRQFEKARSRGIWR